MIERMIELFFLGLLTMTVVVLSVMLIGTLRGRVRPYTLLAAFALGLLTVLAGVFHTVAVTGTALKNSKPYDFRFVSLIATGLILIFPGALNIAISRWISQGQAWAIAMSAAATLFLWVYFILVLPISSQGIGILLHGCFLCYLLLQWNASHETSIAVNPRSAALRAISRTGITLVLVAVISQLALAFGSQFRLDFGAQEAGVAATFISGPAYGVLLFSIFSLLAWFRGRALAKQLQGERLGVHVWIMAAAVVLVTALFRVGLELYLRAASGGGMQLTQPTLMDVFVYGTMLGAVVVGTLYDPWKQSTIPNRAAVSNR